MKAEDSAVISGIGCSEIGRRLHRDPLLLTAEACLAAISDAGLTPDDIDGISTYPGMGAGTPGLSGAGADDIRSLLGLKLRWHTGAYEVAGQLGSLVNAVLALAAGVSNHVLCFRSVWESTAQELVGGERSSVVARSPRESAQWGKPYGVGYPTRGGLIMQRYLYESGATREQLAQVSVVSRANAARNPLAVYRDPITVDDYLNARMISDPLCLYDCDVPVDGAIAVVLSRSDVAKGLRIEALGSAGGIDRAAEMMWSRTDLKPADVDVAELYDGFSILAVLWLEALGLVPTNETGPFIEGGHRIAIDGQLPINTGGGQLSSGRLHGFTGLLEACLQLRGEGGRRQVPNQPEIAVVSSGIYHFSSCLLLTK